MDQNSTYATGRRAATIAAAVLYAALALITTDTNAQSAPQSSEPGTQRLAASPSLLAPAAPAAVERAPGAAVPAASKPTAASTDPYFAERPKPATIAVLFATGILVVLLIVAGVLLIVRGLREDLRNRKRGYRRRSRRIVERSQRPPLAPAG